MATLTDRQKTFIVEHLACFERPQKVAEDVKREFDLQDVDRHQVGYYDPTSSTGPDHLAQKWVDLFHETRKRFKAETQNIAIANKAYRLEQISEMERKARRQGNFRLAARLLEQAAKEMGGKYTDVQKLEHSGPDGDPVRHSFEWGPDPSDLTDDQLERIANGEPVDEVVQNTS